MGISPPKVRLCGLKRNSSSGAGRNTRGVKEVQSEKDWSAPSLQSESQQVGDAHRKQEVSKETQGRTEAMGPEPRFGEEKRGHPLEMAFEGKPRRSQHLFGWFFCNQRSVRSSWLGRQPAIT